MRISFPLQVVLLALIFSLSSTNAFAKRHKRKKEKLHPDIRCTFEYKSSSENGSVDVRLKKMRFNIAGKDRTVSIDDKQGDEICNEVSQILWKRLVKAEQETDCSDKSRIFVREKRHSLCIPDLSIDPNFQNMKKLLSAL